MAAGPCRRLQLRLLLRGDKLLADIVPFRFAKVRPESFYGRDPFQNTKTLFRNLQNQPFHAKIRRQEDCALVLSISASHTIRERIGAVIRADHAAFSGFRSTFLDHESRNSWSLPRCQRHQHRWRSRVLLRNGSAPAANCVAGAVTDACGLANPTPEEEPGSPAEVRSQRKRRLPSVDE